MGEITHAMWGHTGDYLRDKARSGLRPRTIKSYEDRLASLKSELGHRPIGAITARDLDGWLDRHCVTDWSRHSYRSTAIDFWRWLVDHELLERNEAMRSVKVRVRSHAPRPVSGDELRRVMSLAPPSMLVLLALESYAGLRACEVAALRWDDVSWGENGHLLVSGKGGKPRSVPLHPEVERALLQLPEPRRGGVARRRNGGRHTPASVSTAVARFLRSHGLEATGHQLRHSFASALYNQTDDIYTVAKVLGHADPATTTIYAAWKVDKAQKVVRALVL